MYIYINNVNIIYIYIYIYILFDVANIPDNCYHDQRFLVSFETSVINTPTNGPISVDGNGSQRPTAGKDRGVIKEYPYSAKNFAEWPVFEDKIYCIKIHSYHVNEQVCNR